MSLVSGTTKTRAASAWTVQIIPYLCCPVWYQCVLSYWVLHALLLHESDVQETHDHLHHSSNINIYIYDHFHNTIEFDGSSFIKLTRYLVAASASGCKTAQKRPDVRLDVPDVPDVFNVVDVLNVRDVQPCLEVFRIRMLLVAAHLWHIGLSKEPNVGWWHAEDRTEQFINTHELYDDEISKVNVLMLIINGGCRKCQRRQGRQGRQGRQERQIILNYIHIFYRYLKAAKGRLMM